MIQQFSRLALSSQDYLFSQINDSQIPNQFHDSVQIEKLDSMMIQNFKSFDKKYVGPFLNFTSIIGPNGSGKSNILDALMFCFCSQNSRHSLIDARQLINRQGKQTFKQLSKINKICSVEATFILKNGEKFITCRTLDPDGKEQYLINYKNLNKKVYQNILLRKGINCNSPNYAIWQGQIDRLIFKNPSQLTNLLQNLSGSIYLKKPYQDTKQRLTKIQTTIQQKTRRINKLKGDRKNLRSIKQTSDEYQKYDTRYQQILKKVYYLQVLIKQRQIEDLIEEFKKAEQQEKKKINDINEIKANAQKDFSRKMELQEQMNKIMNKLAEKHAQMKSVGNPANVLKLQKLKQTEQQVSNKIKEIQFLKNKKKNLQDNMPEIPSSTLIQQYLSLYEEWESQNTALHREITKKKNELLFIQRVLQSKQDLIKQFEQKKLKNQQKNQERKKIISNLKQDLQALNKSTKLMQSESTKIGQQVQKYKEQYNKMNFSFQEVCSAIEDLENLISEQAQDQKQAEMLKNLANVDGFYGALHQKIKPTSTKYDICFSIMFSGVSKYLICSSEESSKKIGNRLKQIRMMKNVIILDNVVQKRSSDIRKQLGKDGTMGIDIVDFDQDTKGLKQYLSQLLFGKVICDNITTAYKIRNKNIQGVKQIYTLDGNVIRKDGVISTHGNPQSIKKIYKYSNNKTTVYQQLTKLNKQKLKIETQLRNFKMKFDQKEIIKRNLQIDQMNKKKQLITSKLKQMQSSEEKELVLPQSIINEVKDLEKQRDKLLKTLGDLQRMIKNSKIFDKFLQKHKIDNLQAFRNANNFDYVESMMKKKTQCNKQIINIEQNLQSIQREIRHKNKQIKLLQDEVKNIPQMGDKSKIQKIISQCEKQLLEIRGKLSKLTNVNRGQLSFQSTLPLLQAKVVYAKQKIAKQLQDFTYQLGVQFKFPIQRDQIIKQLNLPRKITEKTLQSLSEKFQEQKNKIEQQLDKHNSINLLTNVKQDQQKLQKGMNNLLDEIEQAIKQRKKVSQQLEAIRKDRSSILLSFINTLRQNLVQSYKLLTQQQDGSSGNIILYVQSEEQPFENGVYYTPTPPTKRFVYDLEQLSGGQRSIASLALQYSISLTTKSPILILDQTDAFLDIGNVNRFLKLIYNSLHAHKIQMIVVTHKQGLFSKSESLVGVSRPKSLNLSQVYSLKLQND